MSAAQRPMTRRAGFTLFEVLVSLLLTGTVAALGAATFGTLLDRRADVLRSSAATERAAAVRALLTEWIADAEVVQAGGVRLVFEGRAAILRDTGVTEARSTGDEVRVLSRAHTPIGSPQVRVRLFVDGDPDTPERGLTVEFAETPTSPIVRRELDATIRALTVEYFDRDTRRWVPPRDVPAIRAAAVRLRFPALDESAAPLWHLPLTLPVTDARSGFGLPPAGNDIVLPPQTSRLRPPFEAREP